MALFESRKRGERREQRDALTDYIDEQTEMYMRAMHQAELAQAKLLVAQERIAKMYGDETGETVSKKQREHHSVITKVKDGLAGVKAWFTTNASFLDFDARNRAGANAVTARKSARTAEITGLERRRDGYFDSVLQLRGGLADLGARRSTLLGANDQLLRASRLLTA